MMLPHLSHGTGLSRAESSQDRATRRTINSPQSSISPNAKAMPYGAIQDIEGGGEPAKFTVRKYMRTTASEAKARTVQKLMARAFRDRPGLSWG